MAIVATRVPAHRRRAFACAASAFVALSLATSRSEGAIVERVVAVVGDRALLLSDLEQRLRPRRLHVYRNVPDAASRAAALTQLRRELLEVMVDEVLEAQTAAQQGLTVNASEIEHAVEMQARQNAISVTELYAEVKANGLSAAEYRDEIRRQLLSAKLTNMRISGRLARASEDELRAAYERLLGEERGTLPLRAAGIELVDTSDNHPREAERGREQAVALAVRARRGEDFAKLAAEWSSDRSSRERGGVLDAVRSDELPEPIDRALRGAEPGEVVGPVRVGRSWWVVMLLERAPSSLPPFEQAKAQLQQRIQTEKFIQARRGWLDGLRRRTHVEVRF